MLTLPTRSLPFKLTDEKFEEGVRVREGSKNTQYSEREQTKSKSKTRNSNRHGPFSFYAPLKKKSAKSTPIGNTKGELTLINSRLIQNTLKHNDGDGEGTKSDEKF